MLTVNGISKRFGRVQALSDVDLEFPHAEIHALLGENGAGKSTLMHVVSGLYQPDSGALCLDGRPVRFPSPLAARAAGIGMVHQHFTLVEPLTVAENLVLSLPHPPRFRLSSRGATEQAVKLARKLGLDIGDPSAIAGSLPVGTRQRIEIVKALAGNARILILDEPTAVLTREETEKLFTLLRRLRDDGRLILFITHKLREVTELADRVTVMRRGRIVTTRPVGSTSEGEMAELMIGATPPQRRQRPPVALDTGERLVISGLCTRPSGGCALRDVRVAVRAGEIFGIAGVSGNGQQDLFEVLVGLRPATAGEVRVNRKQFSATSPALAAAAGVGHIPSDRHRDGLALAMSVADNAVLNRQVLDRLRRGLFLSPSVVRAFANELVERYGVRADGLDAPVSSLSGGNQQRLIVGRQLTPQPDVLVAVNPTRGLDIAAAQSVYDALDAFVATGRAVLLISGDLDEVLDLSHRFAVLHAGRLSEALTPPVAPERIGRLMAGAAQ